MVSFNCTHAFNCRSWRISQLEASLVYRVFSRTAWATQRISIRKRKKEKKNAGSRKTGERQTELGRDLGNKQGGSHDALLPLFGSLFRKHDPKQSFLDPLGFFSSIFTPHPTDGIGLDSLPEASSAHVFP